MVSVKHFSKKKTRNVIIEPSNTYLLIFGMLTLPTNIKVGLYQMKIDLFVPNHQISRWSLLIFRSHVQRSSSNHSWAQCVVHFIYLIPCLLASERICFSEKPDFCIMGGMYVSENFLFCEVLKFSFIKRWLIFGICISVWIFYTVHRISCQSPSSQGLHRETSSFAYFQLL